MYACEYFLLINRNSVWLLINRTGTCKHNHVRFCRGSRHKLWSLGKFQKFSLSSIMALLKPLGTLLLWYSRGFEGPLRWASMIPRDANLTESCSITLVLQFLDTWIIIYIWIIYVLSSARRVDSIVILFIWLFFFNLQFFLQIGNPVL